MRSLPKYYNTRKDYEFIQNCGQFTEAQIKAEYQKLLDSRFVWETVGELLGSEEGTEDETHHVITEGAESGNLRYQQELVEDQNARIFRLGFTVSEVETVIGG